MQPAQDDRLLPNDAAAYAANTWLGDGSARGFRPQAEIRSLTNSAALKVFRIPNNPLEKPQALYANSTWMEFTDIDTDVLRTPVINDSFERYYWASPSAAPRYNSLARIQNGQQSYLLGVPAPPTAPGVTPSGGVSEVTETRAYLYTWVTVFGEEGAPSGPAVVTGKDDDTWHVTLTAPGALDTTDRNITNVRIYRTVTSDAGVATYFLVGELPIATTTYNDTNSDATVTGNNELESTNWNEPPSTLKGVVAMPNGIFAGWTGSDVYFTEPYRPHAWPAIYSVSVDQPIVGLGVVGQTLVVATKGRPVCISGVHPAQMAQSTIPQLEPCLSRASIVPSNKGVVYASADGLVVVNAGGLTNMTADIINKEDWLNDVDPYELRAVRHATAYIATHVSDVDGTTGIVIDGGMSRFSWFTPGVNIKAIQSDFWTGDTFLIYGGKVYQFNPPTPTGMNSFTWKSKLFMLPFPRNLGAAKVIFTVPTGTASLSATANTTLEQDLAADQYALFKVYADGTHIFTRELRTSGGIFKLPSGFKATSWQFEVTSRVIIESIEVAPSTRELRGA